MHLQLPLQAVSARYNALDPSSEAEVSPRRLAQNAILVRVYARNCSRFYFKMLALASVGHPQNPPPLDSEYSPLTYDPVAILGVEPVRRPVGYLGEDLSPWHALVDGLPCRWL